MVGRWGFGPVFAAEWVTTSRRWQAYAARAAFVGILLLALTTVWAARVRGQTFATIHDLAAVGRSFYVAIVSTEMILVLLAAPAVTAGAVCQDKGRGNLAQLLVTDLSDAEIVLGKLAGRLVPVLGLVGCTLPVLALGTLLGGIDPAALAWTLAITLGLAVFGCSLALTFSIWGTKPYEVLLATFAVFAVWMLMVPVWEFFVGLWRVPAPPDWIRATNPYTLALSSYIWPGRLGGWHFAGFVAGILALSALLVATSIWRIRAVVVAQADRPSGHRVRRGAIRPRLAGVRIGLAPALEDDPVLWYEWHRARPSPWIWSLVGLYAVFALAFTALALVDSLVPGTMVRGWFPAYVVAFEATMGLPLLLVSATTALVEERA